MANQYKNKVVFGNETLIDLTEDTVEEGALLAGYTAHDRSGRGITGTVTTVSPSDTNPAMDGTASAGSSELYSRGDHVHPTDTSRQTKITASGLLKGNGSGGVTAAVAGTDYQAPISNNVTGSGTNGYLTKFSDTNTVTNGPAFGTATNTFLRNDGSWATPTGSVTGVKGNSESSYRTGQVNITAANIGAAADSHTHAAGDINSGTLGVARGGTGAASFTANSVVMSGASTTAALTTRAVTNNTSSTALAANTNIPTNNTVYYGVNHRLNRTTAVNAADTAYTTCMARGMSLHAADTNPTVNGAITWTYA